MTMQYPSAGAAGLLTSTKQRDATGPPPQDVLVMLTRFVGSRSAGQHGRPLVREPLVRIRTSRPQPERREDSVP